MCLRPWLSAAAAAAAAIADPAKPTLHGIPSLKLTITELNPVADAPAPALADATAGPVAVAANGEEAAAAAPSEVVEIDEWILDFGRDNSGGSVSFQAVSFWEFRCDANSCRDAFG
jgi:hypothetical protein